MFILLFLESHMQFITASIKYFLDFIYTAQLIAVKQYQTLLQLRCAKKIVLRKQQQQS